MIQKEIHTITGMSKDLDKSKMGASLLYDAQNIRITAREDETLYAITNEKGTKEVKVEGFNLIGVVLGHCIINEHIILFTKDRDTNTDYIYLLIHENDTINKVEILYSGVLNFSVDHPIETLGIYENEDVQKVYWIDGLNQTRGINIKTPEDIKGNWDNRSFDFVQLLSLKEEVDIERVESSYSGFHSGVVQYALTYYNTYGAESNVFYVSPLQYLSKTDRGGSPEETVNNSFRIKVSNLDERFKYIRVYQITKTSIDGQPIVKRLKDINPEITKTPIKKEEIDQGTYFTGLNLSKLSWYKNGVLTSLETVKKTEHYEGDVLFTTYFVPFSHKDFLLDEWNNKGIFTLEEGLEGTYEVTIIHKRQNSGSTSTYITSVKTLFKYNYELIDKTEALLIDDNTIGEIVDSTELLYKGGEEIVFQTMTQKDNTLFLGNAELKRTLLPYDIKNLVKDLHFEYHTKDKININSLSGNYPYENTLLHGSKIQTYKTNEWYRIGIQFQHITGKWSEPLFIGDFYNDDKDNKPQILQDNLGNNILRLVNGSVYLDDEIQKLLIKNGYLRARGVIVYPQPSDREVVFQGIACPTLYNVEDRYNGNNFSIPSWFSRPNVGPDIELDKDNTNSIIDLITNEPYKKQNNRLKDLLNTDIEETKSIGKLHEFRHAKPIPNSYDYNGEIQSLRGVPNSPYLTYRQDVNSWVKNNKDCYFVDQSIITIHSPDLEFNEQLQNLDSTELKMRIVGYVPFTGNMSNLDIQLASAPFTTASGGPNIYNVGVSNVDFHGGRSLGSGTFYQDVIFEPLLGGSFDVFNYVIFPWHKETSLMNQDKEKDGNIIPGLLKSKKMSNLKYSTNSYFLNDPYYFDTIYDNYFGGIAGVQVINSEQNQLIKIHTPQRSNLGDLYYTPTVDKVITPSLEDVTYKVPGVEELFNKKDGYPILVKKRDSFSDSYDTLDDLSKVKMSKDPIRLKYKSTPHAIVALNRGPEKETIIMPTNKIHGTSNSNVITGPSERSHPFWEEKTHWEKIKQDVVDVNIEHSYLWLVEIYNDNVSNRFGGTSKEAIKNNNWLPAGESVSLQANKLTKVPYTNSDTYYQRYDCLKTYPYSLDDVNTMVDIVSFMCETRVNIDGRYDRNRGRENNLVMTPKIFNLLNPVYSQTDNYFNYRSLDEDKFKNNKFPNTITWTKEKQFGSDVDTWTNITMASTLDLDGDKGEITSLNTFNNEIFCFQTKGFSNVLFNSRVQIPSSDGVPIEISNSYKVDGKRYISEQIGCTNKWSIVESPAGLYFIDNFTNTVYLFNGQMNPISDTQGFRNWLSKFKDYSPWKPIEFNNIKTFYDRNNKDVYFVHKNFCLGYSEILNNFVSFYSYNAVPTMFNVANRFYSIKGNRIWEMFAGDYNIFFDQFRGYSLTLVSNENRAINKMFNTVEYVGDLFDEYDRLIHEESFDNIQIKTDYQVGTEDLKYIKGRPSNLKKKFRVWRANIPRDDENKLKRVVNPWATIKLSKNKYNTLKMKLKDIIVSYSI